MKYPDRLATRLSVSFVLLFLVTFSAVVLLTLYYAQRTFQTSIDDNLQGLAETVEQRLSQPGSDNQVTVEELSSAAQFVELLDSAGNPTARSSNLGTSRFPAPVSSRLSDHVSFRTFKLGSSKLRAVRYPVIHDGIVSGYVIAASPIPEVDDSLQSLAAVAVVAGVLGMSMAVVGTVWLSVRESRPLRELTDAAHATAAAGFGISIPASEGGSREARELRGAFSALVERQREVLARERAFFADSSHVLRTPLAVLQGDIEMLEQGVYGKERVEVVAQARANLEKMSRAISGLLLLARESDASGTAWEVVELSDVLHTLVEGARVASPTLSVSSEIDGGLEIAGDPHQINDLFVSILENARRYTPNGGTVHLSATRLASDVVVEVRDSGIGLGEEAPDRLKERFYRGAVARKVFPEGSGLGLAIADRIVRIHQGTFHLSERAEGGTSAKVTLPLLT
ncbi:MAG: HAMP domain-containing sensor histidine kinase [Tepidiformaceae bacterium]